MAILDNVWLSDLKMQIAILEQVKKVLGNVRLTEAIAYYQEKLSAKEK